MFESCEDLMAQLKQKGDALLAGALGDPDETIEVVRVYRVRGPRSVVLTHLTHAKGPGQWTQGGLEFVAAWGPVVPVAPVDPAEDAR